MPDDVTVVPANHDMPDDVTVVPANHDMPDDVTVRPANHDMPDVVTVVPTNHDMPDDVTVVPANHDLPDDVTVVPANHDMPDDVTVRPANHDMPDDGDCSDTDMEVKSLDLTGTPGGGGVGEERARPMSWEGALAHNSQEDGMRELEEPMSPMSPDAPTAIHLPHDQVFVTTENTNTIITSPTQQAAVVASSAALVPLALLSTVAAAVNLSTTAAVNSSSSVSVATAVNATATAQQQQSQPPALLPLNQVATTTANDGNNSNNSNTTILQQHLQQLQFIATNNSNNNSSSAAALLLLQQQQQQEEPLSLVQRQHLQLQQQLQTQQSILQQQLQQSQQLQQQIQQSQLPHSTLDSPIPARGSDSGCEVLPGPYTPNQSPLLPRFHSPNPLYSPTESPGITRHLSGFASPYSHSPSTGLSRNNSDASQYGGSYTSYSSAPSPISPTPHYSPPSQQIHDVEHLWRCSESELREAGSAAPAARAAMAGGGGGAGGDVLNDLCQIADNRLYKIVKWCKSLPLFRHIAVIVLLSSDVAGLKDKERVQYSQERVLHSLEEYTRTNYPHQPGKYGEILMRIPELQRTCHTSKELLSMKKKEGDVPSFNFLFELLRGDH
ncbi:uncharacterized protein LOC125178877 [Hyalella azteca]|uniref:Uncharacterized protein LOC125178877 n=1 Tax=Hyalella azteca TaxID=294128 RepID=A0A979FT60_HYAAZ|nr:uncharacterized protein LOC125178877 [Hyalella azteca]